MLFTKHGEKADLSPIWDAIVALMDDEKREAVHMELAPCTEAEFLTGYLKLDPDFESVLSGEFSIDAYNDAKTYYMINSDIDPDTVFGPFNPICLDEAEVKRLSADWEVDLFEDMHEASREEIAKYGVYDSPAPVYIDTIR